jgi:indole-3-glycerol phosphate synthase
MIQPRSPAFLTMPRTSTGILSEIVAHKRLEVAQLLPRAPEFERAAEAARPSRRDFRTALLSRSPAIIAEIKKASPSKGLLAADFDPPAIARAYERGGAACLSVLTDQSYFQGSLDDLTLARSAVRLPVLRKDFTLHRVQILEAAAHHADAILLIAAALGYLELRDFREFADSLGLASLIEVHDEVELDRAIASGAQIVGVNNRNLESFEVTLETSLRLSARMPSSVIRVSESGICTRADIDRLRGAGYSAFLVGETLMRSQSPETALKELLEVSC